jgi:hypothetical protein
MDTRVLVGLLELVGLALAPVLMVSILVRVNLIYEAFLSLGRRLYLFHTPPVRPAGPPLEKLAADLRRLRPEARSDRANELTARQRRALTAYDAALVTTARALDVETTLADRREGWERDAERFRLEHALTLAGLSWQVQES